MSSPRLPLARFQPTAYALLRIVAGAMFCVHGMQKLFGWFGFPFHPAVGSQMWLGGLIEFSLGLLIAVGLFTRVAAFIASGEMAVAYFQFHWKLQVAAFHWIPVVNQGELAVLYCFLFLFIATTGPGRVSLDARLRRIAVGLG